MEKENLSGAELINPYDDRRDKTEQVEQMFDSIAPAYDFMNSAMTFGLHRSWRRKALDAVTPSITPDSPALLDIATGTGDLAFDLHRRFPKADITGLDLSEGMLAVARQKLDNAGADAKSRIRFVQGDSLALPFHDNSFDLITVAYGVRNFEHLDQGLKEMARVLKPGGSLCVIELSEPVNPLLHSLYRLYSRTLIPMVGRLVSGDSRAYSYLPESIAAAPQRGDLTEIMTRAGLCGPTWKSLTFGVVTYYLASKPDATAGVHSPAHHE